MTESLKRKIGQMLMAGFPSPCVDEQAKRMVEDFNLGNFVLFARNFVDYAQTGKMCGELSRLAWEKNGVAPIISTDQEGGSTCRTVEGAALFTGPMASTAAEADTRYLGRNCADVLSALGVNTDLAPVVDVNSNPMNPIIGTRSFGDTADRVKKYCLPMLEGMREGGVLATVKHYPGHGNVNCDSHIGLPNNPADSSELYSVDFEPFKAAFAAGADALMSCHVVFNSIDPDSPATVSKRIMTGLLRDEMGFTGIAMTDCLEMGAIAGTYGTGEGAVRAIEAGCDVLCISHTYKAVSEAANAIYAAVESGRLTEERIDLSYERIMRVKRKYALEKPFVWDAEKAEKVIHDAARIEKNAAISRSSITALVNDGSDVASLIRKNPAFISPCALALTGVDNVDASPANFAKAAFERFGGEYLVLPLNEMNETVTAFIENSDADVFVLGLYNGRFRDGQMQALRLLEAKHKPLVVVTFGAPYDANEVVSANLVIAAYEYTPLSMNSVLDALADGVFTGKLPVALR